MRKIFAPLIGCLFGCAQLCAQTAQNPAPLDIGDSMPDVVLGSPMGRPNNTIRTSDLKGKLVLLDFWNIWCSSCVAGMPKLEALQKKFAGRLQIIVVTQNSEEQVLKLFSRVKIPYPSLPIITRDTLLQQLFPHSGVPHHVWINGDGRVEYITFDHNATEANVQAMLEGKKLDLAHKRKVEDFDWQKPVIQSMNNLSYLAEGYSLLARSFFEFAQGSGVEMKKEETTGYPYFIKAVNAPLKRLYTIAYSRDLFGFDVNSIGLEKNNRILLQVRHPSDFAPDSLAKGMEDQWYRRNLLTYELMVPQERATEAFDIMQQDLNRYLPYQATLEKRKVKCLLLVATGKNERYKTPAAKTESYTKGFLQIQNSPISVFLQAWMLYHQKGSVPLLNETGYWGNVNLKVRSRLSDLSALREDLQVYGLDLIEAERNIDMLVIRDKIQVTKSRAASP